MKKYLKSVLCLLLVVVLAFSAAACGGSDDDDDAGEVAEVVFPLETPVSFTAMITGTEDVDFKTNLANNKLWQKLKEESNVDFDFLFLGTSPAEKLALLVNSDSYGDVLMGSTILTSVEASKYIAAGKFKALDDYVNEKIMPKFMEDIAEDPEVRSMITATDGKIYTLPKITGLEGHYVESPIWINKAWLNKLGLSVPTTATELTNVLQAFKTGDPNGNGLADEIPYIAATSHSYMHTEALAGMYGIATKDGSNDSFVQVRDGKVVFAPVLDAYKEYTNYLGDLYTKGLLWKEVFTANSATLSAKLTNKTCVVGMFTSVTPPDADYASDFEVIPPPAAAGYQACWYMHPAIHGSKNQFYVMDSCKNTNVLMHWFDFFFDLDYAITAEQGNVGDGRLIKNDEGKYQILELDSVTSQKLQKEQPTLMNLIGSGLTRSITASDYADKIVWGENEKIKQSNWAIYKDYVTKEVWPRPYYDPADSYAAAEYTTDIFNQVQQNRAKWVTAGGVSDADFEAAKAEYEGMGLQDFLRILQNAYDAYISGKKA